MRVVALTGGDVPPGELARLRAQATRVLAAEEGEPPPGLAAELRRLRRDANAGGAAALGNESGVARRPEEAIP